MRHNATGPAIALVLGIAVSSSSSARADCANTKDLEKFTDAWYLATGCNFAKDQGKNLLTGLGKQLASAALDTYAPGLSSMLGLGGSKDPFAAHVATLLNAIDQAEKNVINEIDASWLEARAFNQLKVAADFSSVKFELARWQNQTLEQKLYDPNELNAAIADLSDIKAELEHMVLFAGSATPTVGPYPYMNDLHTYILVLQLLSDLVGEDVALDNIGGSFVGSGANSVAQFDAALDPDTRSTLDAKIRAQTRLDVAATLGAAFGVATNLHNTFRGFHGWRFTGLKDENIHAATQTFSYMMDGTAGTKFWVEDRPDTFSSSQTWYNVFGSFDNYTKSFDDRAQVRDYHRSQAYKELLMAGYAPFRVALDGWWDKLVAYGERSGFRPYTEIDADLDAYIVSDAEGLGGGTLNRYLTSSTDGASLSNAQRSRLIGFMLQFGHGALDTLAFAEIYLDPLSASGRSVWTSMRYVRSGGTTDTEQMKTFYRGQFAAKVMAIL